MCTIDVHRYPLYVYRIIFTIIPQENFFAPQMIRIWQERIVSRAA